MNMESFYRQNEGLLISERPYTVIYKNGTRYAVLNDVSVKQKSNKYRSCHSNYSQFCNVMNTLIRYYDCEWISDRFIDIKKYNNGCDINDFEKYIDIVLEEISLPLNKFIYANLEYTDDVDFNDISIMNEFAVNCIKCNIVMFMVTSFSRNKFFDKYEFIKRYCHDITIDCTNRVLKWFEISLETVSNKYFNTVFCQYLRSNIFFTSKKFLKGAFAITVIDLL